MKIITVVGTALCAMACLAEPAALSIVREQWTLPTEEAKVVDGTLVLDGRSAPTYAFYNEASYSDVSLEARYSVEKADGVMAVGFVIGSADSETFLRVHYDRWSAILYANSEGGAFKEIKRVGNKPQAAGTWYTARLVRKGKTLEVFFNGKKLYDAEVSDTPGRIGFYASQTVGTVKDIRLDGTRVPLARPWRNLEEGRIHGAPKEQARAQIKWVKPICVEKDRYIGWPTVCHLANGDLLTVFSGDRDSHICPWGKVQVVRSTDDGETWSAPVTIAKTILDDRDAGIVQLPDGEIVVTWFTSVAYRAPGILAKHPEYKRHDEKLDPDAAKAMMGYFLIRSRDNGKTWSKPEKLANCDQTPHGPIVLKDGSLLQIGRRTAVINATAMNRYGPTTITVSRSTDAGRTWTMLCPKIPDMNGENSKPHMFHEPHVAELADGKLVGMVRYHGDDGGKGLAKRGNGYMRQTVSTDGGKTWTPMAKTGMLGLPPHLLVLPDGKLVCVYGRRLAKPGFGEFAAISDDGGKTWDVANEISLAPSHCGDLGYPASCLLANGDILTVFYQQPAPGQKTCLMAARWRVK